MKRNGKNRLYAIVTGISTCMLFLTITFCFISYDRSLQIKNTRIASINILAMMREKIDRVIMSRLMLAQGIVTYISLNPDMNYNEFQKFASAIINNDPIIKNVSILKNTTIIFAVPIYGNEKAIGIDLLTIPAQRDTVLKAIETHKPVIAGPVELVQGGYGIISRIPIYAPSRHNEYWGQASIVLRYEPLFELCGLNDYNLEYDIAIKGKDGLGKQGGLVWGDENVFTRNPITMDIDVSQGAWVLAVVPKSGWGGFHERQIYILLFGICCSFGIGVLVYSIIYTRSRLRVMAYHDSLTGLSNRIILNERLTEAFHHADRNNLAVGLVMLDLDNFKSINDNYGHDIGDLILVEVGRRLTALFRSIDSVIRLGGDEFMVILEDVKARDDIDILSSRIRSIFNEAFQIKGVSHVVDSSLGCAVYPEDTRSPIVLLKIADDSMYSDKKSRKTK